MLFYVLVLVRDGRLDNSRDFPFNSLRATAWDEQGFLEVVNSVLGES